MDPCLNHPLYLTSVETEAGREEETCPGSPSQAGPDQEDPAQTHLEHQGTPALGPSVPQH